MSGRVRACTTFIVVSTHAARQAHAVVRPHPLLGGLAAAMRPSIAFLLLALVAALGLGACGESKQDRRKQVQDATKTFTSQLQSIAGSVGKSTSLSDAKAQLTSALQQLGDAYKQSFAQVDCR
jgi:hypothetical protein